jgi:hypothetical protein
VATETDAARDRVLAARAALGDEIDALEASARAAVDIPAKVRQSPAKAAAIAGSAGFVVLGGPKRIFGAARRAVFGPTADLPKRMLPDEIEKTLKKLGDDGNKVRGALERDFAAYAKEAEKDRGVGAIASAAARPLMIRGAKAAAEWFLRPDEDGFQARLRDVQGRAREEVAKRRNEGRSDPGTTSADGSERGSA